MTAMGIAAMGIMAMPWTLAGCCFDDGLGPVVPSPTSAPFVDPPAPPDPPVPEVDPADPFEAPSLAATLRGIDGVVPQRPDAPALFERASAVEGRIHRGVLVCRANVRGEFDDPLLAGGADVAMSLQLGSGERMLSGQRSARTYTFPIAALEPGTTVTLQALDLDILFHDPIGGGSTEYRRAPFVIEHPNATLECRALVGIEADAQRALAAYRRAIDAFVVSAPALTERDLGFPDTASARAAAESAASWVGWRDPEMVAALAHAAEVDRAALAVVARAVRERRETLAAGGAEAPPSDRTIRIAQVLCDDEARRARMEMGPAAAGRSPACHVVLELEARSSTRLTPSVSGLDEVWTLREDGTRERARAIAARCGGGSWAPASEPRTLGPGERCEIHLGVSSPAALLRIGPELARIPFLLPFE